MSSVQPDRYAEAVSSALQSRAPEKNRTGWYLEISDKTGLGEKSIAQWCYGNYPPDGQSYWKLVEHFGVSFHDDVTRALTGWRVVENDKEHFLRIENAAELAEKLVDTLKAGGKTKLGVVK